MYLINRKENSIEPLQERKFLDLELRERDHLQEWVAKHPSCLGEDLLVIQKEFDGFSGTRERLDLLALDKEGRLVIIENKLDDADKDVTWQALKYASYCAYFGNEAICEMYEKYLSKLDSDQSGTASERIADFLGEDDLSEVTLNPSGSQRIVLIAANFPKEVTSPAIWLMNFKLKLQCFEFKPWSMGDQLFLSVEQIIPGRDTEDLIVNQLQKNQDEEKANSTKELYKEFWTEVIEKMQTKSELFKNVTPQKSNWIRASSVEKGIYFRFSVSKLSGWISTEIYIDCGSKSENKSIFDKFLSQKENIEKNFGKSLEWKDKQHAHSCSIKYKEDKDISEREKWPDTIEFMTDAMKCMEKAFGDSLNKLGNNMRSRMPKPSVSKNSS